MDEPVIKETPGGWMAVATDSPLIAVVAGTEAGAAWLFRARRAVWRGLMAEAQRERMAEEEWSPVMAASVAEDA
jgi:hypothetical protein